MKRDLASVVEILEEFIGYKLPPNALPGLLSHMHIDNFRKNDAVNMKPPPGTGDFIVWKVISFFIFCLSVYLQVQFLMKLGKTLHLSAKE